MKKQTFILIALCLLISTTSCAKTIHIDKDSDSLTKDQLEQAENTYGIWLLNLYKHLMSSSDVYEQSMGLAALINHHNNKPNSNIDPNDESTDGILPFAAALNALIKTEIEDFDALDLVTELCFSQRIEQYCFKSELLEQLLNKKADFLTAYLPSLKIAVDSNNQQAVKDIFELMATAKTSRFPNNIKPKLIQSIDAYIENNPVPKSAITAFKDDRALLADLSKKTKKNIDKLVEQYLIYSTKTSFALLNGMPDYRHVLNICKENSQFILQCLKIGQIMINESNSVLTKGVGYAVLMATHEANNNTEILENVKKIHDGFKATFQCYMKASSSKNFAEDFLDAEYQRINLQSHDEITQLKELSAYIYKKHKKHNPDQINPKKCESNPLKAIQNK